MGNGETISYLFDGEWRKGSLSAPLPFTALGCLRLPTEYHGTAEILATLSLLRGVPL